MALFKSNKNEEASKETVSMATIITKGTTIVGDIVGEDSIHVDGDIKGSITVNNIVVVGKSGVVNGNIEAQKIISNGTINGNIKCDELEVLETSIVKSKINARKVHVVGKVQGDVLCDGLIIDIKGEVEDRVQAKSISVSGSLTGEVACDLLSTKQTGVIKGSMYVSNISNEGGKVEGSIGQYKELISSDKVEDQISDSTESKKEKAKLKN